MDEIWKDTPYKYYQVSHLGNVRSIKNPNKPRPHKAQATPKGYMRVMLMVNGRQVNVSLARLVTSAFVGSVPLGCVIHYDDGNRQNCALMNLSFIPKAESTKRKREKIMQEKGADSPLGREIARQQRREFQMNRAKDAYRLVKVEGLTMKVAAEMLGMSESGVCRIVNGSHNKMLEKAKEAQK